MIDQIQKLRLLDPETGELIKDIVVLRKRTRIGGHFMKVYQDAMGFMAKTSMRGKTLHVFLYLLSKAGYVNVLPSQRQVAKELSIKPPAVSRAFKELAEYQVILPIDGRYILSPYICWKGSTQQLKETLQQVGMSEKRKLLQTKGEI